MKKYSDIGTNKNLTISCQTSDCFNQILIYKELPNCKRTFLGVSEAKKILSLPTKEEVLIVLSTESYNYLLNSHSITDHAAFRFRVEPNEKYKITYEKRNGSEQILLLVQNKEGSAFQKLSSLPDRQCSSILLSD